MSELGESRRTTVLFSTSALVRSFGYSRFYAKSRAEEGFRSRAESWPPVSASSIATEQPQYEFLAACSIIVEIAGDS